MSRRLAVMLAVFFICAGAFAQKPGSVVARVNGQAITQEALTKTLMDWFGRQTLEEMIQAEVIAQAAKKAKVSVTDEEVDKALEAMRQRMDAEARAGLGPSFAEYLGQTRRTEAALKSQIRTGILLERMVAEQAKVSDIEAAEFYEKNLAKFREPALVKVSVISLKTEEKAKEVRAMILKGEKTWGDAAREFNVNPRTMQTDGALGYVPESDSPIAKAAHALEHDGDISEVIAFGGLFNIVKREDRRNARTIPFEEARPRIKEILTQQRTERLAADKRDELMRAAHIERLLPPQDTAPAPAPTGPAPAAPAGGGN